MFLRKYVKARHILFLENIIKMFGDKHVVNQGAESYFLNHKLLSQILTSLLPPAAAIRQSLEKGTWGFMVLRY